MTAARETRLTARLGAQLSRPMASTFLATATITGLNVVSGVILARELGPTARGQLAAAILWTTLLSFVAMMGATEAISYRAARPGADRRALAGTLLYLSALQGVLLVVLGAVVLPLTLSGDGTTTLVAGILCLGSSLISGPPLYAAAMLNGTGHYTAFNLLRVLVIVLRLLVLIVLAVAGSLTVITAAASFFAGVIPTFVVALILLHRVSGGIGRPDPKLARSLAWFGWRTQLSSVRNPLNEQLDQLVISVFLAPIQLGLYAVAYTVASVIGLLSGTIAIVALPGTARTVDLARSAATARRYLSLTFITSVAVAGLLMAVASPLVRIVFGDAFGPAIPVTRLLLVAAVFTAMSRVGAAVLNGLGRPGDAGVAGVIALSGMAIGIAVLLPTMGIEGAALGTLGGYVLSTAWCLVRLGGTLRMSPLRLLVPLRRPPAEQEVAAGG